MAYVDGFLFPIKRRNISAYRALARKAGKIWREHGALEYRECLGDDLKIKGVVSFHKSARTRRGEVVFFSWIVYRSKAHRDLVNKRVMKDPRAMAMMTPQVPFDVKRMAVGGFKVVVDY